MQRKIFHPCDPPLSSPMLPLFSPPEVCQNGSTKVKKMVFTKNDPQVARSLIKLGCIFSYFEGGRGGSDQSVKKFTLFFCILHPSLRKYKLHFIDYRCFKQFLIVLIVLLQSLHCCWLTGEMNLYLFQLVTLIILILDSGLL